MNVVHCAGQSDLTLVDHAPQNRTALANAFNGQHYIFMGHGLDKFIVLRRSCGSKSPLKPNWISGCAFNQAFSSGVRDTIVSGDELCALTGSALNPVIEIETARKAIVKDL